MKIRSDNSDCQKNLRKRVAAHNLRSQFWKFPPGLDERIDCLCDSKANKGVDATETIQSFSTPSIHVQLDHRNKYPFPGQRNIYFHRSSKLEAEKAFRNVMRECRKVCWKPTLPVILEDDNEE